MNKEIEYILKINNKREIVLPYLINRLQLKIGAEIGVSLGKHAKNLLKETKMFFYLVDHYSEYIDMDGIVQGQNNNIRYNTALNNLKEYIDNGRCKIIREESKKAAEQIKDGELDFCYIDADHSYQGIKNDMSVWTSKVKINGILAGHDYKDRKGCGVIQCINEIVEKEKYKLYVLGGRGKGWLFIKDH